MKTNAVRLYGVKDLRMETFELPEIKDDEILACVISDSICMSTYKAAIQGPAHKRVPEDVAENPVIVGHEFCGKIIQIGKKWENDYKVGDRFVIQPALNYKGSLAAPGYSYKYCGGAATYVIMPNEVMECGCLLPYSGDAYFYGSLAEPMSCIVGGFHANYHGRAGSYVHEMGIVPGGSAAILAGAGPMGLGAVNYAIHCDRRPSRLIVTDIDEAKLQRAASIVTVEEAKKNGVELIYLNTANVEDQVSFVKSYNDGNAFNDVFVFAPVKSVVELADALLARDGCLNFFAGPSKPEFSAMFNFYNVHYSGTHIVGTSGGNTDDMIESVNMMSDGALDPSGMISHVGGLDSYVDTVLNLPNIPGAKKLCYTHIPSMPMTAITDFAAKAEENKGTELGKLYADLADICGANGGLWCKAAEDRILEETDL